MTIRTRRTPLKTYFLILALLLAFFASFAAQAKNKKFEWTAADEIKPGDKVCVWDISLADPLVHNVSSDSLKYWYRSPTGRQKSYFRLRPMTKGLLLRVMEPGARVVAFDKKGRPWHSLTAAVLKGGHKKLTDKARAVRIGTNILMREKGRTYVLDWQILRFEKARFRKKGLLSCERKYKKY